MARPSRPEYAELHIHTAFSFLDGASLPEELVGRAADLGYRRLGITDHDGLHGALEFARAARAAGIAPVTGAELTLDDGTHLTLLAASRAGYGNLCRLLTAAYAESQEWTQMADGRRQTAERPSPPGPLSRPRERGSNEGDACVVPTNMRAALVTAVLPSPELGRGAGGEGRSLPVSPSPRLPVSPVHHYRDPLAAPRLDPALLPAHAEGLVLLTGCRQGQLARLVDAGYFDEAEALLRLYVDWFGPQNVVVELQQNLVHGDSRRIDRLVALAERVGVPYAATGNVHYHRPDRHRLQDVLVAIRHNTTLDGCHRQRRPNAEFFLRPAAEMAELFHRYPRALRTTVELAERCADFDLSRDLAYRFPDYDTPSGESPDSYLAAVCRQALDARYGDAEPAYRTRAEESLETELKLIRQHGLAGFFLVYRDLLELAREVAAELRGTDTPRALGNLPPGRGRGSSVSSIVCYLIGLSPVDPLRHNLFLGRFLNEEISSVPDIDLDFPRDIREKLIERVYERYPGRAALVCAFSTYRLRSAVRDVGKALGLPAADLDRIAKLSEPRSARELDEELGRLPEFAGRRAVPPWKHLVELAAQLAGFPRHVTQHVGGMIVTSGPVCELVPIQPAAMAGRYLCQWDKDSADDAGFVKIDFLALGMLSLVEECLELIHASDKPPVDLSRIDFADEAVFEMIRAGDTVGVFQIESRAQIQMLARTQPRTLDDLVVQVAIVRPGPIVGGAVAPYVRRREAEGRWGGGAGGRGDGETGRRVGGAVREPPVREPPVREPPGDEEDRTLFPPVEVDHPLLEPVLRETLGVILYQEQVIEVAMALAGFTAGQADQLRRAMSRKRSHEAMVRLWAQFRDGALAKGVELETARAVFRKLLGFASYGFPKCHAAAFAFLAYQSCWLKRHHPAEFLCALLNNQPMGFYPPHVLVNDAKRHGLRIMPPDVNDSAVRCTVEGGNAVRIGLTRVRSLGEEAAARIVAERAANGPFRSLADFLRRVPLRTEAVEHLIMVGAFDRFGLSRREALWQFGLFVPARGFVAHSEPGDATPGRQLPLSLPIDGDLVELPRMGPWDQMVADYDRLALSPRYHPLGLLRPKLPRHFARTNELPHLPDGTPVRVAGLVVCRQRPGTAKGITFLLLEDEVGLVNVVVYPALYQEQRQVVRGEPFLLIEGRLQRRDRSINVLAVRLHRLDDARETFGEWERQVLPQVRELDVLAAGHGDDAAPLATEDREPWRTEREAWTEDALELLTPASHNYR